MPTRWTEQRLDDLAAEVRELRADLSSFKTTMLAAMAAGWASLVAAMLALD